MNTSTPTYKNHRFPPEIISHGVRLYVRFCLSYRDVGELLFARGIIVTYESIRKWCQKFGQVYAHQLRRRRPQPADKWHLDAVFLTIDGQRHYLWRAVDQEGNVLVILVQSRRDKKVTKKFFRKLLKGFTYVPRVIITDQRKSYGAAKREPLPDVEHRQHHYLHNRVRQEAHRWHGRKSPLVLSGNRRVVGAKPCRALCTVSSMPLKGTGAARGKPPRGRAWLRDRLVSSHAVGFNLRGIRLLA